MRKFPSIKKRADFQEVYHTGKSYANKELVMYVRRTEVPGHRIGISVSKKVGNSVIRHRVTRLIREAYRLHQTEIKTGYDIVVVARVNVKDCNYWEVERAFMHVCRLHHLLNKEDD